MADGRTFGTIFVVVEDLGDRFIRWDGEALVADLVVALRGSPPATPTGLEVDRTGRLLPPELAGSAADIRSGDVIRLVELADGILPDRHDRAQATATMRILSGPLSGRRFPLGPGVNSVGRASDNDIVLIEPSVSRHHGLITVDHDSITLNDKGSTNGITVDGNRITAPTDVPSGQRLLLGRNEASIVHHRPLDDAEPFQDLVVAPPSRPVARYEEQTIVLPAPPDPNLKRRRTEILTSGRVQHRQAVEQFRLEVQAVEARIAEGLRRESAARLGEAPSIHELLLGADARARLWERRALDPCGLEVRIGLAEMPSRTEIRIPDGGPPELREMITSIPGRYASVGQTPAVLDLRRVGTIALSGPAEPVDRLAYSIVTQLAWLHGPDELGLVHRPGERADAWDWLKWLPHVDFVGSHNGVPEPEFVAWISRLLDQPPPSRTARPGGDQQAVSARPVAIVVVLDGDGALPTALKARLFEDGPALGIYSLQVGGRAGRSETATGSAVSSGAVITVESGSAHIARGLEPPVGPVAAESIELATAAAMARRLTPLRLRRPGSYPGTDGGALVGKVPVSIDDDRRTTVGPFRLGMSSDSVAGAVVSADGASVPPPRDLASLPHGDDDGRLVLGTAQVRRQAISAVFACNLGRDGSLGLVGGPGSGKTCALRTVAAAAMSLQVEPGMLPMLYHFDVGGGLVGLDVLAGCNGATGHDVDRYGAVLSDIERLLTDRAAAFEQLGVTTIEEHRRVAPDRLLRRALILVDEVDRFIDVSDGAHPGRAEAILDRLAKDGGPLGVHLVVAAADRSLVAASLADRIGRWLHLGVGLDERPSPPGSALIGGNVVRFATLRDWPPRQPAAEPDDPPLERTSASSQG